MLAYVFWHWKQPAADAKAYEDRQRAFHEALAAEPPPGFIRSFSLGLSGVPWAADGGEAYEDWYLVKDFGALGALNEAAVSASRAAPHAAAAEFVDGGVAGLYGLRAGEALEAPTLAWWFGKPDGMSYNEFLAELNAVADHAGAALWMRQMVLGPGPEFCLHSTSRVSLPDFVNAHVISFRAAWEEITNA